MKKIVIGTLLACSTTIIYADTSFHTNPGDARQGTLIDRRASDRQPGDAAAQIDRSQEIAFVPDNTSSSSPSGFCETPASLACVYGLTPYVPGCPINATSALAAGINNGGQGTTIAVVEQGAYLPSGGTGGNDYDNQLNDLQTYSTQFNLTQPTTSNFVITKPSSCSSTTNSTQSTALASGEHILDLDMIHAMAQNAKIVEVEADTTNDSNACQGNPPCSTKAMTDAAINCAVQIVRETGGGFVSDSYGGEVESSNQIARNSVFNTPGAVIVQSSGDYSAPPTYPGTSPYVISAGASSIIRDANGNFVTEEAWDINEYKHQLGDKSGTSGGPSMFQSRPIDQIYVQKIVGTQRGTPDFSADGDPKTGPCVYSQVPPSTGWYMSGGTSAAAPELAGILDTAPIRVSLTTTTQQFLTQIYQNVFPNKQYYNDWRDGRVGFNGYPAMVGYDFVTGIGTPRTYNGK